MRPAVAGKGRVDAVHTRCSIVDKPVEIVDSHMQPLVLPWQPSRPLRRRGGAGLPRSSAASIVAGAVPDCPAPQPAAFAARIVARATLVR